MGEKRMTVFSREFLDHAASVCAQIDAAQIERIAAAIAELRDAGGRLFVLGVGGSAGNAGHAVQDFRKLCDVEAYAPTDNVSEMTARINDEGWETVFAAWLAGSRIGPNDAVLVLSIGGGSPERNVSMNLVHALRVAKERGARIFGVVGRDGGHTARVGDEVVIVPTVDPALVTPLADSFQAIVWHCLVSHPALKRNRTKW
jgi:D-sedoheptulose 7-phosphate isomerase